MYGKDNFGFLGNPNLNPENSKTFELGYGNNYIDVAIYQTEIDNLLVYEGNTYRNDNATSVRKGADVTLTAHKGNIRFLNKTGYVIAQDSSETELLRRPQWQNNLNVSWYDNKNWYLSADWNYYGSHKDLDSSTFARMDAPAHSCCMNLGLTTIISTFTYT